jgi:hypothetical protein
LKKIISEDEADEAWANFPGYADNLTANAGLEYTPFNNAVGKEPKTRFFPKIVELFYNRLPL